MLTISVLGPTELRRDGVRIPLASGKATELLVRLALDAGVTVRADRLIEDLWGADADVTARNTLQAKAPRGTVPAPACTPAPSLWGQPCRAAP